MTETCAKEVQIKAAGGVRSLDEFLYMMRLGVTRTGTSGTVGILKRLARGGLWRIRWRFHSSRRVALKGCPADISRENILSVLYSEK